MRKGYKDFKINHEEDDQALFPPGVIVEVKSMACELPTKLGIPLSRFSMAELRREVIDRGIVALVIRRCHKALALSKLDISKRHQVQRKGESCFESL